MYKPTPIYVCGPRERKFDLYFATSPDKSLGNLDLRKCNQAHVVAALSILWVEDVERHPKLPIVLAAKRRPTEFASV
jgi:hypothetical protein